MSGSFFLMWCSVTTALAFGFAALMAWFAARSYWMDARAWPLIHVLTGGCVILAGLILPTVALKQFQSLGALAQLGWAGAVGVVLMFVPIPAYLIVLLRFAIKPPGTHS